MYQGMSPYGGLVGRYYQGPYGPPTTVTRSDEEIRNEIVSRLQFDPWVNEQAVNIEVSQGTVTLTGEVDVMEQKRSAGDDAWDTPGVIDVNNQLRARKLEPLARARREAPMGRPRAEGGEPRRPQERTTGGATPRTR